MPSSILKTRQDELQQNRHLPKNIFRTRNGGRCDRGKLYLHCDDRLQEILAGHKPRQAQKRKRRRNKERHREGERKTEIERMRGRKNESQHGDLPSIHLWDTTRSFHLKTFSLNKRAGLRTEKPRDWMCNSFRLSRERWWAACHNHNCLACKFHQRWENFGRRLRFSLLSWSERCQCEKLKFGSRSATFFHNALKMQLAILIWMQRPESHDRMGFSKTITQ